MKRERAQELMDQLQTKMAKVRGHGDASYVLWQGILLILAEDILQDDPTEEGFSNGR